MKHLLAALDRALDMGEAAPARPFNLIEALERAAPGVVRKAAPISLAPLPAAREVARPVVPVAARRADLPVPVVAADEDERPLRGPALAAALADLRVAQPEREPWPAEWFEGNDPIDSHRCQQMWAEALRMMLIEVCETVCKDFARQAQWDVLGEGFRRGTRPDVRPEWIGSRDFNMVCALAGLDAEAVVDRANAKLSSPQGAADLMRALSTATTKRSTRRFDD